ncbi:CHAP domain-containing protein [Brumimicrobium mesophilum]|uniref:CHAP domain-containing protein n=1 Tax=Brumimicrobium mesophilum TaxID=392717 RepID=UPI000D140813|nr:CHAP domain-containing protein [Brumimicrobium mesophilum]
MKIILLIIGISLITYFSIEKLRPNLIYDHPKVGEKVDSLNNVYVYYNDKVGNVIGRNTKEGYNIGLKYQCVEFVKRYYYQYYNHKMPDSYGHALSFYNIKFKDGELNTQRNLLQFTNPSSSKPKIGDLIVFDATIFNSYGHVAIVSNVSDNKIEIIQQNPGPNGSSRDNFYMKLNNQSKWEIESARILGWLRK